MAQSTTRRGSPESAAESFSACERVTVSSGDSFFSRFQMRS
jgi:hypothetical protein